MKKLIRLFLIPMLIFTLTACSDDITASTTTVSPAPQANESGAGATIHTEENPEIPATTISVDYDHDDLDSGVSSSDISYIELKEDSILFNGSGATVENTRITITSAGTYDISGTLNDGQIRVDTQDKEKVKLILNGVDLACSTSAPIYVSNAEKTVITLADGTENTVTDGTSYLFEDTESDEPNAAIFSHDDLTLNGSGSLTVKANYNNGITSKDDLKVTGGTLTINAVNDGLKGKDSVAIKDGMITINAGGDGIQANNDTDAEKGYISIEGGTINITAGLDGMQAETNLTVSGGDITISSGGGSINTTHTGNEEGMGRWGIGNSATEENDAESAKGLKAGIDITISGGSIHIDSADDAIHTNDSITINDGDIVLTSGDDGIHSDATLDINGGHLSITQSYEGIESTIITINDGTIAIFASDDGINVAGGNDGSSMNGRPGQNTFNLSGDYHLYINGGYVVIDANGDGLDSNGPADMTGGVVIVNGPTGNNNGAMDYTSAFNITGGFLLAVGSSGMAQAPSESSTQYSVMYNFTSPQAAGTLVHIETEDGEPVLTFAPKKDYQSVVLSSSNLENGVTYTVYTGGSSTGTVADGLYAGGTYTGGTQVTSFTISSMVTSAGASGGGFRGGPGGPGGRAPQP